MHTCTMKLFSAELTTINGLEQLFSNRDLLLFICIMTIIRIMKKGCTMPSIVEAGRVCLNGLCFDYQKTKKWKSKAKKNKTDKKYCSFLLSGFGAKFCKERFFFFQHFFPHSRCINCKCASRHLQIIGKNRFSKRKFSMPGFWCSVFLTEHLNCIGRSFILLNRHSTNFLVICEY